MILHPDLLRARGRDHHKRLQDQAKRERLRSLNLSRAQPHQERATVTLDWQPLSKPNF